MKQEKNVKYILLYSERHESYDLFADLKKLNYVQFVISEFKPIRLKTLRFLKKVHLSSNIADVVRLPFKGVWYKKVEINTDDEFYYYIIVFDLALSSKTISLLRRMNQLNNVKLILVMINSSSSAVIRHVKNEIKRIDWDAICTFDENDAKKYGYKYIGHSYYSKHDIDKIDQIEIGKSSDIYYIGALLSNRKKMILSVYEYLRKYGLDMEFHLLKSGKERYEFFPYKSEIDYYTMDRGLIPYGEVLASVRKTNTILEIMQFGQTGPTLRYYEAVCYNKKLLTNNPYIVGFPFYDKRFMRVFERPEDIDVSWVKSDLNVDYHYNNEFSPIHLLDKIREYAGEF